MVRRVAIVAFEGCASLDVVGPFEVLHAARVVQRHRGARDLGYEPFIVGTAERAIASESGLRLAPDTTLRKLVAKRTRPALHTLMVAGGDGARRAAGDTKLVRMVATLAARAERVSSVCTGAFVLGAAGLLDGKRATTHWARCDALARACPKATIERDPIYVRDGSLWTSAGVTAGIDLALSLVDADLGREVASLVARWLVVFVRRAGGQSQFSAQLAVQAAEHDSLAELMSFVVEHPGADLQVPALARRAHLSVRHFSRLFRAQTGVSPAQYVEHVRVETARRLLETSARSVEQVARDAGFGTPEALRRAFARRVRLSPREYRARFGGPLH
jgi:transcriptional regulator GlxA family with amidase domain